MDGLESLRQRILGEIGSVASVTSARCSLWYSSMRL